MSEQTTTDQAEVTSTRTFYPSDYRRMAATIKAMRSVRHNRFEAKPQASQDKIGALVTAVSQIFEDDAAGDPEGPQFTYGYFVTGTQLPEAGQLKGMVFEDEGVPDMPEGNSPVTGIAYND